MNKKILFISHDAILTGAPVLLLNLIQLLKNEQSYTIKIIVKNGVGNLLADFENAGEMLIWKKQQHKSFLSRVLKKLNVSSAVKSKNNIEIQKWIDESDIVISNTITNGDFLGEFNFTKVKKVISYVHELEVSTGFYTNKKYLDTVKEVSDIFLVPAKVVSTHLVQNLNIEENRIFNLNYYIPLQSATQVPITSGHTTSFVVGTIGTLDWRKGADLLPVVVAALYKKYPGAGIKFIWKGATVASNEYQRLCLELKKLKLADKVLFEPPGKDVTGFYQRIDLLLLLSREDPYPLVVLESASHCKPCLCFKDGGGAPEFVQADAGDAVPYLDIEKLTDTIYLYAANREQGIQKGNVAFGRYQMLHYNKELILDQFEQATRLA